MPGFGRSRGGSQGRSRGRLHHRRGHANSSRGHGVYQSQPGQRYSSPNNQQFHGIDTELKSTIINILSKSYPEYISLPDIMKSISLKHSKQEINKILYDLLRSNVAQKTGTSPQKWILLKKPEASHALVDSPQNAVSAVDQSDSLNTHASSNSDVPTASIYNASNVHDSNAASASSSLCDVASSSGNAAAKENDIDYSDMPPLIDSAAVDSMREQSHNIGGSPFPSISIISAPPNISAASSSNTTLPSTAIMRDRSEGNTLRSKLIHYLSSASSIPFADILTKFKKSSNKKQINHILYALEKEGYASRLSEVPPVWSLTDKGKTESPSLIQASSIGHSEVLGKRQESPDCVSRLESVTISKTLDTAFEPPRKIPRLSTQNFFKDGFAQSNKNPISQLMEYVQSNGLKIDFDTSTHGPDHRRRFLMVVKINHISYPPVEGSSKKDAKTKACGEVLQIIQQSAPMTQSNLPSASQTRLSTIPVNLGNSSKNAISLVNEYAQANCLKIDFSCVTCGPDHRRSFRTILQIGDRTFQPISAGSKKDSKLKAAEAALAILQESGKIMTSANMKACNRMEINTFHDRVASMVNKKFHELLADLPDTVVGRKILAGFVMSQTIQTESGEETQWTVISIGSGNRCVAGDKLSMKGDTVNDCHAEIISRRGLMRFLYQQIESFQSDMQDEDNILTTSTSDPSKLKIKPGIQFHLYISTAPCGDSALFAKSDLSNDVIIDPTSDEHRHHPLFENKKQGILRTKVENGEGCIPIDLDANVPTWDGLLRGERLRTMSCSDKLAKWNYVGLQGALLSHFLQPFYMSSLTLGMLFSHGHLTRAVCCRVEKYTDMLEGKDVSPIYSVHHPDVAKVSGEDPSRDTGKIKTREYSLNWCFGDERAEVLDGTKGRCEARYGCMNPVSQVSKSSLYAEFKKVSKEAYESYAKAKESATDYKQACAVMKEAFEKAECGTWMSKPVEVEEF